jgi:hypothetical protein
MRCGIWFNRSFLWLARQDQIDWSRAVVDSCSVRAVYGGALTGPNPTDRAKRGSKRHLVCDGHGVPLAFRLTGANRNERPKSRLSLGPRQTNRGLLPHQVSRLCCSFCIRMPASACGP